MISVNKSRVISPPFHLQCATRVPWEEVLLNLHGLNNRVIRRHHLHYQVLSDLFGLWQAIVATYSFVFHFLADKGVKYELWCCTEVVTLRVLVVDAMRMAHVYE